MRREFRLYYLMVFQTKLYYSITDLQGNVFSQSTSFEANTRQIPLTLPDGIYFISLQTEEWSVTRKFIVQKE
ncbi:MAG: T9SS type A sorting domain-containing protein [Saprospiraceae bacterium]|nr:T9SS type A sorting domain-containing protein [Saprospiraceae bacterium]